MIQRKKTLNLYILLIMITYRLTIFYVGKSILIKQKRIITTTCQAKQWFFLFHFSRFFKNILHRTGSLFVKDVRFESTVLGPEYSFNSLLIISSLLFFVIRFQENFVFKICELSKSLGHAAIITLSVYHWKINLIFPEIRVSIWKFYFRIFSFKMWSISCSMNQQIPFTKAKWQSKPVTTYSDFPPKT